MKLDRNVNETCNGYSQQPLLCKDASGLVVAAEYFSDLLSPNNDPHREVDDESPYQTAEPTLQEVTDEILRLENFKSPEIENFSKTEEMRYGSNYTS